MTEQTINTTRDGLLCLAGVGKRYGLAWAIQDISLTFHQGECTALLGENGAGKSTVIKIISGLIQPTTGHLTFHGQLKRFRSAREALAAGIAVIPQELAYVPKLTVAENLIVGQWPQRFGFVSQRAIVQHAQSIVARFGFDLDVRRHMEQLPLAERQIVEIIKVLARDARVIMLDEPTASLTEVETKRLLAILRRLKGEGRALIYVSHRLDECFRIAERIAVLRNGQLVYESSCDQKEANDVVAAMLGPEGQGRAIRPTQEPDSSNKSAALEVIDWRSLVPPRLNGVSFSASVGEVVALFGLLGSGAETVARGLGGQEPRIRGALKVDGKVMAPFSKPSQARRARVGYVPAERKIDGLALNRPIRDNLTLQVLPQLTRRGFLRGPTERRMSTQLASQFQVHCHGWKQPVGELSGGNQQKVLLAGRLAAEPRILVLHEPTRGVDIGARAQIHDTILSFARRGATVVVVTSDVDEAVTVADRLLVVRDGLIAAELIGDAKTANEALVIATNATHATVEETG